MVISKLSVSERLIHDYVKTPPSLQNQVLNKLAIHLCHLPELRNAIICSSNLTVSRPSDGVLSFEAWENQIENKSKAICKRLALSPVLEPYLVACILSIALDLFSWNKQHQMIFHTSARDTHQFLTLSDWTVEGRLHEAKIAERLVQDEKLPLCQRYRLACMYYLEPYILLLWTQIPPKQKEDFVGKDNPREIKESELVKLCSYHLEEKIYELVNQEHLLWQHQLKGAIAEGRRIAFVHLWGALSKDQKQEVVIPAALHALSKKAYSITQEEWMNKLIKNVNEQPTRPSHYSEILYFLFSEMSEQQRNDFFQQMIKICGANRFANRLFKCFLMWPYQDIFIYLIAKFKLWNYVPEKDCGKQLLKLAERYASQGPHASKEKDYNYNYGNLMVELLEIMPERYKRFVFSSETGAAKSTWGKRILQTLIIKQSPLGFADMKVVERFLQQATTEEKLLMIYAAQGKKLSWCGEELCEHLVRKGNWELIESIFTECLPREAIASCKKQFFLSWRGSYLSFQMLQEVSEESINTFLNWGCSTEEEKLGFKSRMFFKEQGSFSGLLKRLQTDCLDRLMQRCLPSKAVQQQYKEELIKEIGVNVCEYFIIRSMWEKISPFFDWCFLSEEAIEKFKYELFVKKGLHIHGALILHEQWQDAERFFEWLKLSPRAIEDLKKDTFFSTEFLCDLCVMIDQNELVKIARCLEWSLADKRSVIACKKFFQQAKPKIEFFKSYPEKKQQVALRNWDRLIEERISEIVKEANRLQEKQAGELK